MQPLQSKTALGAFVGLLGLVVWGGALWGLDVETGLSWLLWVMTGGAWLALGYALGWVSRPAPPAKAVPALVPLDMSQLTTEQLFQELERMNHAALQRKPEPTQRVIGGEIHAC